MGTFISEYGGDLKTMLLKDFIRRGRGDDFVASMSEGANRDFGTLAIRLNSEEYARAVAALEGQYGEIMIVGVEDMESGSPYVFVRMLDYDGKHYMFPVIFNAELREPEDDGCYSNLDTRSYRLRLGDNIDPERRCALRIVYAPGKRIEWSENELQKVFAKLG